MKGEHIIDGAFQSDKYPWCKRGFFPLKFTDKTAHKPLWDYAQVRREVDPDLADDLETLLLAAGYKPTLNDVLRLELTAANERLKSEQHLTRDQGERANAASARNDALRLELTAANGRVKKAKIHLANKKARGKLSPCEVLVMGALREAPGA